MRSRILGRTAGALAAVVLSAAALAAAPAHADGGDVVVRGLIFPEPLAAQLSLTGCTTLHGATPEQPQPYVGIGPGTAPAGTRSLGFDLEGGNAAGGLYMVGSVLGTTTAEIAVHAAPGSTGVAYVGYQERADSSTPRIWIGRAELVAAGGWQRYDATRLTYTWTKHDLGTGAVLQAGPAAPATVRAFAATRGGDGAGLYALGFGCDGRPFSLDALRIGGASGVRTYDLEGLATTTSVTGDRTVVAGGTARLTGAVRDHTGQRVPQASLLLEGREPGTGWEVVEVVEAGATDPVVEVAPERTTTYRFRFVDRPLAEGSASAPFTVAVTPAPTAPPGSPTPGTPAGTPAVPPSGPASARPTAAPVAPTPSETASAATAGAPTVTAQLGLAGDTRVVTGAVSPVDPGAVVLLGRLDPEVPALAQAEVGPDGAYSLTVPPGTSGDLVVRLSGRPGRLPAASEPLHVAP